MKLFLLTPIYEATTQGSGTTPVVHYFAKEWVKQGHEVHVLYMRASYPKVFYWLSKKFSRFLISILNQPLPLASLKSDSYTIDGVKVTVIPMRKFIPHTRYSKNILRSAINTIKNYCSQYGLPDYFVGHWHNPQLELLNTLKSEYKIPTCLVFHNNGFDFTGLYKGAFTELLSGIDIIGFRSRVGLNNFSKIFGEHKKSFIAVSGVSSTFLKEGQNFSPDFSSGIHNYIYVGILMSRKYPTEVFNAIKNTSYGAFELTYVGDGDQRPLIEDLVKQSSFDNVVKMTGRIHREEVIKYLKESQVFVMISKDEIFGLVYLEAMALGLITIGSRDEGIDGIIQDGVNGFLCEAGNQEELERIINHIKTLSTEELENISINAKKTAFEFSDSEVARKYLQSIVSLS